MLAGCFYRYHTPIKDFIDRFFVEILSKIHLERKKYCVIMGDFNINFVQIDNDTDIDNFCYILSAQGFRPLIRQSSRVHSLTIILLMI